MKIQVHPGILRRAFQKTLWNIRNRKIFRKVTGLKWMKTEALQEGTESIKD